MGIVNRIKGESKQLAINMTTDRIIGYVQKSPEKNFDKVISALSTMGKSFGNSKPFEAFIGWMDANPGSKQWFINLMKKDRAQVANVIKILFGNCSLKWAEQSKKLEKAHGFTAPYSILISPTMKCNLHCKGCYAENYRRDENMPIETFDDIIKQGKDLGTYLYTILGGEPFVVFDDVCAMAKKHSDCLFQVFTNGTLITPEIADRIAELKNIVIVFSVNGDRDEVDYMRGNGVYDRVVESMKYLDDRNLMFGMSLVLTSRNYDLMTSEAFYNTWRDRGVMYAWNFLFMPVVKNPDLSLMPTPEQRVTYGEYIKEYREKEPLFIMDFWADAPAVHGCIAGGRRYLHINHKGDVEPCIFAHFATHNIHEHSLLDALKSPFFTAIRQHQPHTDNLLRPCMIIDNPEVLRGTCKRHNARPTAEGALDLIEDENIIAKIDEYAKEVARVVDPIWEEKYQKNIADMLGRERSYPEGADRLTYRMDRQAFMDDASRFARNDPSYTEILLDEAKDAFESYEKNAIIHQKLDDFSDDTDQDTSNGTIG
ncbi:MAG: radical SAM protein [Thermodesulfobacteriota bacterium]|nr:radical SAM protein [Thermodesulfobacteriota bacterium]